MVGWSPIIVVVIDTFRPNSGWIDPIIEVIVECFRLGLVRPSPIIAFVIIFLGPVLVGSSSIFDDVIK
jgi:hypothetical protein